jgi:zinc finger CCHC domain-containing protein 9
MTRYTKLGRKQHEESGSWEAAALTPAKPKHTASDKHANDEAGKKGQKNRKRGYSQMEGNDNNKNMNPLEKRRQRRALQKMNSTICFACRQQGHAIKDCPEAKNQNKGICYNCGSTEHSLKACRKPRSGSM